MSQPILPGSPQSQVTPPGARDSMHALSRSQMQRVARSVREAESRPQNTPRGASVYKPPRTNVMYGKLVVGYAPKKQSGTYHPGKFKQWLPPQPDNVDTTDSNSQPAESPDDLELPCWAWCIDDNHAISDGDEVICEWIAGRWIVTQATNCPVQITE
ncbi:MAG TPA: hypothetical protein VG713_15265 [Pirellulales bacterium]|nr:hypothetical protein [Pirellulales bacterium]